MQSGSDDVVIERWLSHSPDKLWRALTQGELIADWLMANDFQPVVGHRFILQAEPNPHWNGRVEGRVLEVEPHKRLAYTWTAAGGLDTVVTWTLHAKDGGVQVTMQQTGFGPDQVRNLQGARYGWEKFMDALDRVVSGL